MQRWRVTDEFRVFMREVAAKIDWTDDRTALVGPEAVRHECGYGGRLDNSDVYRFIYLARDGHDRYEVDLNEQQIRDVAAGHVAELEARVPGDVRIERGEGLLVWGEYDIDALRVRGASELAIALDGVRAIASLEPCVLRLWSRADEQLVAIVNTTECAVYVVQAPRGYGTSVGDQSRTGAFDVVDHHLGRISVAWAHCVSWAIARPALLRFAEAGDVGDIALDGTIPTQLLMVGDFDRAAELATRPPPPTDPALSSLPRKAPHGAWAKRLLKVLVELQLVELDTAVLDSITARTAMLLVQHGDDAQETSEAAQQLAKAIARLRGVATLFATGGDLQIALRRTQDPPTMPIEVPI